MDLAGLDLAGTTRVALAASAQAFAGQLSAAGGLLVALREARAFRPGRDRPVARLGSVESALAAVAVAHALSTPLLAATVAVAFPAAEAGAGRGAALAIAAALAAADAALALVHAAGRRLDARTRAAIAASRAVAALAAVVAVGAAPADGFTAGPRVASAVGAALTAVTLGAWLAAQTARDDGRGGAPTRARRLLGLAGVAIAAAAAAGWSTLSLGALGADLAAGELPSARTAGLLALGAAAVAAAGAVAGAASRRVAPIARAALPVALAVAIGGREAARAELAAPRAPAPATVSAAAGAESPAARFEASCRACHSRRDLRARVAGKDAAAVDAWLVRLDRLRGRMPPLAIAPDARRALAAWLAGLGGAPASRVPPDPARVARGRVVARRCLVCHDAIPLRPRVAGLTEDQLFDALGRLDRLQSAMPGFAGSDAERADLAAYLAALGAGLED